MLTVYVFSQGEVAKEVFNAVSAFVGGNFHTAISLAMMFAILMTAGMYTKTHDIKLFFALFVVYVIANAVILVPKVTVQIIDESNPLSSQYVVDNVPWGLAVPASFSTTILYDLMVELEDTFHMPDDLEYNKTGMMFGSQLLQATLQTTTLDDQTKSQFNDFVENCIIPDISIGKYTWGDIANSPNLFQTLDQYSMSPLRGLYINGKFNTCAESYPVLKKELGNSAKQQISAIAIELFGSDASRYEGVLPGMIESTYARLLNSQTTSAQDIIMQNTVINYFRNTLGTLGARMDTAAAAQLNYSYTSAMQRQNVANLTGYRMATYTLPLLQTALFLILVGAFPLFFLVGLMPPFTKTVAKYYPLAMVYLASWPLLYVIANFIVTAALSTKLGGFGDITFSNLNQVADANLNFVSIASYLFLSIPTYPFIFKGAASIMNHVAQSFSSAQSQVATGAASEAASGNIGLGNMHYGNKSWENIHANKFDTNVYHAAGASTFQGADGVLNTTYADGSSVMNASGAISQGAFSLNFANTDSSSIQRNFTKSMSSAQAESTSAEHILQDAFNKGVSWSAGEGNSQALHYATSKEEAAHVATAYGDILSIAKDYNQRQGLDDSHIGNTVSNLLASANLNAGGKIGGGSPVGPSLSAGIDFGARGQVEAISSHTTSAHEDYGVGLSDSDQQRLSHDVSILSNYGSRISADSNSHQDRSLVDQQAYSIYQSQQHVERANDDYQQAISYQNQMSQMQSDSQSYNLNRTQAFIDWGKNLSGEDGYQFNTLINQAMKGDLSPNASSYLDSYINRFENSSPVGSVNTNSINSSASGIYNQYESNASKLNNESTISHDFQNNSKNLTASHSDQVKMNQQKFNGIRSEAMNALQESNAKISQGKDEVVTQTGGLRNEITNIQPVLQKRANNSASGLVLDKLTKSTPQEKAETQKKYEEFSNPFKTNDTLNNVKED